MVIVAIVPQELAKEVEVQSETFQTLVFLTKVKRISTSVLTTYPILAVAENFNVTGHVTGLHTVLLQGGLKPVTPKILKEGSQPLPEQTLENSIKKENCRKSFVKYLSITITYQMV